MTTPSPTPLTSSGRHFAPLGLCLASVILSCGDGASPVVDAAPCTPACNGRACGDDGCGGTCGACPKGSACTENGACVTDCAQTCATLGQECGEHCGEVCGTCSGSSTCVVGQCACAPQCAGKTCSDDDGCGGTCGPCPNELSCTDCTLRLAVVDRVITDGATSSVTLAIDYFPPDGGALPTLADLRFRLDGPVKLLQVGIGEPMLTAGKRLFPHPDTGLPYQVAADGSYRVLAMSTESGTRVTGGRWVLLRVAFVGDGGPATKPLIARLLAHEQTLAPPAADQPLWNQPIDGTVVVWPIDVGLPPGGAPRDP